MIEITLPPGTIPLWQIAMEQQLEALKIIKRLNRDENWANPKSAEILQRCGFDTDHVLLSNSSPFAWSKETVEATLSASHSVPSDSKFNQWNLDTPAVWWWFEKPLPIKTLEEIDNVNSDVGVRAISFGWMNYQHFKRGTTKAIGCSTWCDKIAIDPSKEGTFLGSTTLTPSQTWIWVEEGSLEEILEMSRNSYLKQYGPGGVLHGQEQIGVDAFCKAVDFISRFILAGLAWLDQKILVESDGHIERHRRKDFNRQTKQDIKSVKIISLRKIARGAPSVGLPAVGLNLDTKVDWACQWTVDGHWRNQTCGPHNSDRKIIWISPYLKGPEDKPLRVPQRKVYVVNR